MGTSPLTRPWPSPFRPDGKSLAVCRMSHTIELWNLASGHCTYPVGQPTEAQLELRNVLTRRALGCVRPSLSRPTARGWSCSLGGETIRQFQADTGTENLSENPAMDNGHRWPVSTLALSADGKSLYTYAHGDPVRVWDWATGKETGQCKAPDRATHAVFSGEGRIGFATDRDFTLCGAGGEKTWKIDEPPVSLALSPDGSLVAMRFWPNPEVQLRDATTGQKRYTLGQASDRLEFGHPRPDRGDGSGARASGVLPRRPLAGWGRANTAVLPLGCGYGHPPLATTYGVGPSH